MLGKGVPSLFANLKHLYSNSFKKETLLSLVQGYIEKQEALKNGEAKVNGGTSQGNSAAHYFLAQHYNYHLSRDLTKGMEYIDKAIALAQRSPS